MFYYVHPFQFYLQHVSSRCIWLQCQKWLQDTSTILRPSNVERIFASVLSNLQNRVSAKEGLGCTQVFIWALDEFGKWRSDRGKLCVIKTTHAPLKVGELKVCDIKNVIFTIFLGPIWVLWAIYFWNIESECNKCLRRQHIGSQCNLWWRGNEKKGELQINETPKQADQYRRCGWLCKRRRKT